MSKDTLNFMLWYAKKHNLMQQSVEFVYNAIFNSQDEIYDDEGWKDINMEGE